MGAVEEYSSAAEHSLAAEYNAAAEYSAAAENSSAVAYSEITAYRERTPGEQVIALLGVSFIFCCRSMQRQTSFMSFMT
ncbi:hypothetical protein CRH03_04635 [Clostridium sp. HMb25]|nr:hypothetical protein CRH03_04635 [Clostridium sp. HMb25]